MGVEIGDEVPESLYRVVAVVLAWVFWLRVEHHPASTVRLDAWITDFAVFERARDSRAELVAEVAEFGLRLEHFAVFNQPRDTARSDLPSNPLVRVGESLDRSV